MQVIVYCVDNLFKILEVGDICIVFFMSSDQFCIVIFKDGEYVFVIVDKLFFSFINFGYFIFVDINDMFFFFVVEDVFYYQYVSFFDSQNEQI